MTKDCTQPLRIGNIRALNGCVGRLFGAGILKILFLNRKSSLSADGVGSYSKFRYFEQSNDA